MAMVELCVVVVVVVVAALRAVCLCDLRIFSKPYFTTKKEGSGLGLSIVEKILNDHNGFIEFISQKEGAKIKILLPKYVD